MGVLQVPDCLVFSAVSKLSLKMEKASRGLQTIGATLLSSWIRDLNAMLPVPEFSQSYEPTREWDEQDRYIVMHRVLREMQQVSGSASITTVQGWMFRLDAVCECSKEYLEEVRHKILNETIH